MTNTDININSADYRQSYRPQPIPCDGLQFPCENAAKHHIVLNGPYYGRTPVYISTNLCPSCYATWMSWGEDDTAYDGYGSDTDPDADYLRVRGA